MDALKRKMEIAAVAFFCTVTALIAAYSCATTAAANLAQQTAAAPATEYVTLAYMEVQPEAEQEPELLYDVPMSDELQRHVREQAERQGVPFEIALAVIERESSYQPDAVSDTGDFGLMQINICNHRWLYEELGITDVMDPEQKPEQPKKENPAAEPSQKQNKKANIIAIAVAVFFAFMLFGGFDLIAPRKRTTSTTRVSTPETNRSVLEETALNALDKESAAYISSIDAFYYSGKYTLTVRTVSSGGLYLPIVAEQTAQAVFDKAAELGITLSEYKVEEFSEGNSSKVENLILWKSADGVTGTYTDDTGSSPYIETDVTIERLAEIVRCPSK